VTGGLPSIRNLRTRHVVVTRDPPVTLHIYSFLVTTNHKQIFYLNNHKVYRWSGDHEYSHRSNMLWKSRKKLYKGVSKSFRTGLLERELQMVQLPATRCSCIATLWVSLASFAAITICIASQRVFIVVSLYFVIDSVRKLLDTPSYFCHRFLIPCFHKHVTD
jgi:hypothetical protein